MVVSRIPSPPSTLPIMSLLITPVIRQPRAAARAATVCPPSRPFSSPESAAYTIEPRNRRAESTRAASSTAATPLALSLAPGLESTAFMMSETRLSRSPLSRTNRSGSEVPRWIATMLTTLVGPGTRGSPSNTSATSSTSRQPPHSCEMRSNSERTHRRAAPMPRVGERVSLRV